MKTILQCITLSGAGGAQQIVKALCEGFCDENNIILATAPDGELFNWAESRGFKVYPLINMGRSISLIKDIKTLIQLIRIIRLEKPDIVHCHSWKAGVLGRIAAFLCGIKDIYFTVHGWSILSYSNKLIRAIFIFVERLLSLITTKLICVCKEDEKLGKSLRIATENKYVTIYNGVKDIKFANTRSIREKLAIPEESILIGTVARLAPQKRCLETLDIAVNMMKQSQKIYFVFVGDGPLYKEMDKAVREIGVEHRFILAGNQNDVPSYLNSMDIFLLLSNYEGLPVSILEAMSMGIPAVASNVGGVCELIEDRVSGYLVSHDEDEIIQKLRFLIENEDLRKSFGVKSRERFQEKFTVEKMIEGYRTLYEEKPKIRAME